MQDFIKKIDKYQLKITQKLRGKLVAKVLENLMGYAPSNQQVTYVYCLLRVRTQKAKDCEPNDYLQIPVEYLFSLMTPFPVQEYSKTTFQKYMASVTKETIEPLVSFISVTKHNENYCRRFMIQEELMTGIKEELIRMIDGEDDDMHFAKPDLNVGLKPAKWGGRCLDSNKLPEVTRKAWEKLKESRFVFDLKLFQSRDGRNFNRSLKLSDDQREALFSCLDDIRETNEPQYHGSFYIQGPGRLHTVGGPMAMMTAIRKHYIKPCVKGNKIMEMDLKCAQLIILCDILQASESKQQILEIIKSGSIWKHIGPPTLPKEVKKVIIYGFCFGAKMSELPFLATQKAEKKLGYKFTVTKEIVNSCFTGILQPLVELRDKWLDNYTISKIEAGEVDKLIHENALGLKFNLNKETQEYKNALTKGKVNNSKIGAKLLSHLAQGSEQLIIQRLIGEQLNENILTYSYDGLTIEVESSKVDEVKKRLTTWLLTEFPDSLLEFEVY
ncbi:hypothetical protein [Nodularia sphaerocarpa]|uniref:hypothetical protein n=1 Tax=Nodularia sphaerocarpa TaxID=137816 RepID=UPI001EFB6B78|nr:hypothetical protein [Nodularia sphaerocarpa]ULP73420.1 hypothetical protein BDGGKGIB_03073 [Nodularia sphaerocarpa UHCC 0038]